MASKRARGAWNGLLFAVVLLSCAAVGKSQELTVGKPENRPDRLVTISGERPGELLAEYSADEGATWHPATIYLGASPDQRRASKVDDWNRSVKTGLIPVGSTPCVWNYFFDLASPRDNVLFRLRAAKDSAKTLLQENVDLSAAKDVVVIDATNAAHKCGGKLPEPWNLAPAGVKGTDVNSIHCQIDDEVKKQPPTLVLKPCLKGWYRIYLGMEPYSTCRIWLSGVNARYEVPNYYNPTRKSLQKIENRLLRESKICEADMTGQDICISPGGALAWHDVSIRYVRLAPMSEKEIAAHLELRRVAREKGRPFAGYLEPPGNCGKPLTLVGHIRDEMKLNQVRGSTDVYVHVVRIGSKAWYHSDLIEHFGMPDSPLHQPWMSEDDPLAIAVEQARRHGLRIFADAGMNACYFSTRGSYKGYHDRFVEQHPEVVCPSFDRHCMYYQNPIVRDYVVSIIAELLTKYDLDGVHLDFCRWGHRPAYDVESLIDVLRRIDKHRKEAEKKRGRPLLISARVEYDQPPAEGKPEPIFLAAVRAWAKAGLVDRIMVCNNTDTFDTATQTWRWPSAGELSGTSSRGESLGHYLDAIKGAKTKLWGDLYNGTWRIGGGPDKDVSIARGWVEQGLDGGFFYYMRARPSDFEDVNWRLRTIDFPGVYSNDP